MKKLFKVFSIALIVFILASSVGILLPWTHAEGTSIGGVWKTTYSEMTFPDVTSGSMRAPYKSDGGRILGTIAGHVLTGHWVEIGSASKCKSQKDGSYYWGKVEYTFSADFTQFDGAWGYCDAAPDMKWTGTLLKRASIPKSQDLEGGSGAFDLERQKLEAERRKVEAERRKIQEEQRLAEEKRKLAQEKRKLEEEKQRLREAQEKMAPVDMSQSGTSTVDTKVLASAAEWRNSGVTVRRGETYRIEATGKWKAHSTCHKTGPDGVGMYGLLCPAWDFGRVIIAHSHQTLIGKIGEGGSAFAIGSEHMLTADRDGTLFLSINEQFRAAASNSGTVNVTISLLESVPQPSGTKTKPPVVTKRDTTPPSIVITSHKTERGIKVLENLSRARISGRAIDPSGIAVVKINGEPTSLDAEGNFSGDVFLKVGDNKILVVAMDTQENFARKEFVIQRNPKTSMARKTDVDQEGEFGRFYALIIGNNNYQHLPKLATPWNDAKELAKTLREMYGFETEVLLDATRSDILESLNSFRNRLTAHDSFLLYYAGHGEYDKTATKAYWLPVDAKPDNDSAWIIVDSITSNLRRLSSKHILVVADSCYSGTMTRSIPGTISSKKAHEQYLQKMLKKISRTLMASGGNEPVSDSGGKGHSIFSDVFLWALRNAEKKVFTAEDLFYSSIKESVAGRSGQTPEYSIIRDSGHDGGDFLFVRE